MRILVCGLHRSGTSITAHLLARVMDYKIVDDPEFAVFEADGPMRLLGPLDWVGDNPNNVVVKMPRAAEYLDVLSGSDWKTIFVAREATGVFRSILESQFSRNDSVRSMLCYQRAPTRNSYLNGFIDAYLYYYNQILSAYASGHCQVCDYSRLLPTLASAAYSFGLESDLSAFEEAFSAINAQRVDPPHNKPSGRDLVSQPVDVSHHLPSDVVERIEVSCSAIFEEVRTLAV